MEKRIGQQMGERTQARKRDGHCVVAVLLAWAVCWVEWATVGSPRGQVWEGGRWRELVEAGCERGHGPLEAGELEEE